MENNNITNRFNEEMMKPAQHRIACLCDADYRREMQRIEENNPVIKLLNELTGKSITKIMESRTIEYVQNLYETEVKPYEIHLV